MTWLEDEAPARRIWLMTLADLALLLVGFFVLLQATQLDRQALAGGLRAGFGIKETAPAIPLEVATAGGFEPGSAQPAATSSALAWARGATRDPRTGLVITGEVDGSAADVDPLTGSGAILATDRARAIATLLIREGAITRDRLQIATRTGQRQVVLTLGYDGGKQ